MTVDITAIGVAFDTTGLDKGTAALGRTEQAANKAATAADKVTNSGMFLNESQRKTKQAVEDAQASIDKQIKSMQTQAETYGMSARQAALFKLQLEGATSAQSKQADAALKSIESMDKARAMGEQMGKGIKYGALAAVAAVAAATVAFEKLIGNVAKYQDLAEQTGGDPAGIASLRTAADVGGTSIEALTMAGNRLQLSLSKVDDESKGVGLALASIGIEVNAFKQLRPDEQMREIGKALNQYADGGTKVAAIQGILGRGGASMLSTLKELGNEQDANNRLTNEQIQLADDYKDAQARSKSELLQTAESIAVQMLPAITALTGSFKDVIAEMTGAGSGASDLERNKAIQEWSKSGAESVAFLGDAMLALVNIAKFVVADIKLSFANIKVATDVSFTSGGIARDMFDTKRQEEIRANLKNEEDAQKNHQEALNRLVNEGSKFREALAKRFSDTESAKKYSYTTGSTGDGKPAIAYNTAKTGGSGGEKISEYTRMAEAIGKVTALQEQELQYGGKLTASQKFQFDEMQKINFALQTKKISQAESIKLTDMTTIAVGKMVEVERQAYITDAIKKNTEAVDKQYAALAQTLDGMIAANEQQRLENETIGLSTEALNALVLLRQDNAIALKQQEIITAQSNGTDLATIGLIEREIALMQTRRGLTGEKQAKTAFSSIESQLNPAQPTYSGGEGDRIAGEESKKQAAYNATARVAIDAYTAIEKVKMDAAISNGTATQKMIDDFNKLMASADSMREKLTASFDSAVKVDGLDNISKSFDSLSKLSGGMGDGFKKATTALSGFSNAFKTLAAAEKNTKADTVERTQAQVSGYADMAGAAKGFFEENTAGYEIMKAAEQGFRAFELAMSIQSMVQKTVEATTKVTANGTIAASGVLAGAGEMFAALGPFGFPAVAAMLAVMASLGFGGSGGSVSFGTAGAGNQIGADGRKRAAGPGEDMNAGTNYDSATGSYTKQNKPQKTEQEMIDFANAAAIDAAANAVNNLKVAAMKLTAGSGELEQSLMRAKIAAGGAGKAQHDLATQGMTEAQIATYNYNQALMGQISVQMDIANGTELTSDNMKKLAGESRQLAIDLLMASGDVATARAMQRDDATAGYTKEEVAVYDHIQAQKDQLEAINAGASAAREAAQAEQELANKRLEISNQIELILGTKTQKQIDRTAQMAGVTDEATLALAKYLYKLQDLQEAINAATDNAGKAHEKLQRSVQAERDAVNAAYKDASASVGDIIKSMATPMQALQDSASMLRSSLEGLGIGMSRGAAQAKLASFLSAAKVGNIASVSELDPVLKALSKPSENLFSNSTDYQRDILTTANSVSEMSKLADKQVSVQQQALDSLNKQLDGMKLANEASNKYYDGVLTKAQAQIDAMNEVDKSVVDVETAIYLLGRAITGVNIAKTDLETAKNPNASNPDFSIRDLFKSQQATNEVLTNEVKRLNAVTEEMAANAEESKKANKKMMELLDRVTRGGEGMVLAS